MSRAISILLLICLSGVAAAQSDMAQQYFSCRTCHGDNAEGSPAIHAPSLSGQSVAYVSRQLKNFKNGIRGSHPKDVRGSQMALMVANLDPTLIEPLVGYIAKLPQGASKQATEIQKPGRTELYQACETCHGSNGEGNDMLGAPRIAKFDREYTARQLRNFRDGIRGNKAEDLFGQQMRASTPSNLTNQDIDELARYIEEM